MKPDIGDKSPSLSLYFPAESHFFIFLIIAKAITLKPYSWRTLIYMGRGMVIVIKYKPVKQQPLYKTITTYVP
jgi:hypothetical protein